MKICIVLFVYVCAYIYNFITCMVKLCIKYLCINGGEGAGLVLMYALRNKKVRRQFCYLASDALISQYFAVLARICSVEVVICMYQFIMLC